MYKIYNVNILYIMKTFYIYLYMYIGTYTYIISFLHSVRKHKKKVEKARYTNIKLHVITIIVKV